MNPPPATAGARPDPAAASLRSTTSSSAATPRWSRPARAGRRRRRAVCLPVGQSKAAAARICCRRSRQAHQPPASTVECPVEFDAAQYGCTWWTTSTVFDAARAAPAVRAAERGPRCAPAAALVAAGSAPPAQLALRDDVRTRLAWGLVYQLHALTDAEKAARAAHARRLARHRSVGRGARLPADPHAARHAHAGRDSRCARRLCAGGQAHDHRAAGARVARRPVIAGLQSGMPSSA